MQANLTSAAMAYADAMSRKAELGQAGAAPAAGEAGGPGFGELLQDLIQQSVATGKAEEVATMQAAAQQGNLVDVVTAVANAEVTLQTVVAVRDQVIQAYQDIMRMPI